MVSCPLCHTSNLDGATQCRACGHALQGVSTPQPASGVDDANVLPSGTTLRGGAFVIERVLGQGGFGITYTGRDKDLDREVAIKEFFPFGSAIRIRQDNRLEPSGGLSRKQFEDARQNFLEEARVLARFNHPGIVNVFSAFEEKNTAYMVMEYLHGQNLLQVIETRRSLSEHDAIAVIEHVGKALEVVHQSGMLHRDLKPENVLLPGVTNHSQNLQDARVVLIDFGSARAFAANSTSRLEVLVTPGYAPLEQYSDTARFNAYTDIYALGATLYHALTGQAPAAATDRAEGVEVRPPHVLNTNVSPVVSEATMWALQLKASERPQTVHEWLTALRTHKAAAPISYAPPHAASSRTITTTAKPAARKTPDPRLHRMRGIMKELDKVLPPPPKSTHDTRLEAIASRLASLSQFVVPAENQCPSCDERKLEYVAPAIGVAHCPLCDGHLSQRHFHLQRCPVCRKGALKEYSFGEQDLFCPLCQVAPLKKEERKKIILVDLWLSCPNCTAQWDEYSNGTAKLMEPGTTERGAEFLHQTKPLSEWKAMSGRADRVLRCPACAAQLDVQEDAVKTADERLTLTRYPNDLHDVGKRFGGKTFFRSAWARLAQDLPLGAGNTVCDGCHAEWHFDVHRQSLKLLQCEEKFIPLCGQTLPIAVWKFRAKGKTSDRAGHICRKCNTEFDDEGGLMKLVRASGVLGLRNGQKYSLYDWHRIARGLPDSHEETALRHEQKHLQNLQKQETSGWHETQKRQRENLEHELHNLAKQSYLHGYLPALGVSTPLPRADNFRWMSNAAMMHGKARQRDVQWEIERQGTLVITDTRLTFLIAAGKEGWSRPRNRVRGATTPSFAGKPMLELYFEAEKKPTGFLVDDMKVEVELEGQPLKLTLTAMDLAAWLMSKK